MKKPVLFLTFLTGFSGLVFQVVWQKYFSYFLGGDALSSTLVVAIFLGGLSFGYGQFGHFAKGRPMNQLLVIAGLAEIGIGLWAFLFPTFFELLWNHLDVLPTAQPWRAIIDVFVTILFLSPSTILMGSTLPLLTPALAREKNDLSSVHSSLYGINTLGAFAGSIIAGFFLIQYWGLPITLMTLSAVNIVAGLLFCVFGLQPEAPRWINDDDSKDGDVQVSVPMPVYAMSFLSGFVCIGFETICMRSISLAMGTSEYSYSLVVGIFVSMIALGTLSLQWKKKTTWTLNRLFTNQIFVTLGLVALYLTVPYWGWMSYVVKMSLASIPTNFAVYHFFVFLFFALVISIPAFFMGRTMPLLFNALGSKISSASQSVGRIYAVNTIGCCLGGILMGYVMFLQFNADMVLRFGIFLAGVAMVLALFFKNQQMSRQRQVYAAIGSVIALVGILLTLPTWPPNYMASGLFRQRAVNPIAFSNPNLFMSMHFQGREILSFRDDPSTNVSVLKSPDGSRALLVNGKADGRNSGGDLMTTLLLGHLSGLFSQATGDAAVVGLGLGTTARVISQYPDIKHVDVYEIADAVVASQPYFDNVNHDILHNPKVSIFHADAFRGLMGSGKQFATIISEPSNPWVSGVDRLYSTEFYETAKRKLLPGGIFVQWMHTYEISTESFGMVMRTFSQTFPSVRIFSSVSDIVILGSEKPLAAEQFEKAERRWSDFGANKDFAEFNINGFQELALKEAFYPNDVTQRFEEHSLFFPKLSYRAARDFFIASTFQITDLNITDPMFAYAMRSQWKNSMMVWAIQHNPRFANEIVSTCTKMEDNTHVAFNLNALSPSCRSNVLFLATAGILIPPKSNVELGNKVLFLQEVSAHKVPSIKLDVSQQIAILREYPNGIAIPSTDYFVGLSRACEIEKKAGDCFDSVARLQLRFGNFESAKEIFETKLVKNRDRLMENIEFLKQMESFAYLSQRRTEASTIQ